MIAGDVLALRWGDGKIREVASCWSCPMAYRDRAPATVTCRIGTTTRTREYVDDPPPQSCPLRTMTITIEAVT